MIYTVEKNIITDSFFFKQKLDVCRSKIKMNGAKRLLKLALRLYLRGARRKQNLYH